ncbi:MAG: hypothetical protein ABFS34_10830 [Gemmatimonadota bacterium]
MPPVVAPPPPPVDGDRGVGVAEVGRFVIRSGADTVSIETFRSSASASRSDMRIRGGPTLQVGTEVGGDALIPSATLLFWRPGAPTSDPPDVEIVVTFSDAEVSVQRTTLGGGQTTERRDVQPGTMPWTNPSMILLEQVVRRGRAAGVTSVPLYDALGGGALSEAFLAAGTADTVIVTLPDAEFHLAIDALGRLVGGRVAPSGATISREPLTVN